MSPADALAHLRTAGLASPSVHRAGLASWEIRSHTIIRARGRTLREALDNAGYPLPAPSQFANQGCAVKQGDAEVATARSATMAKRIALALNSYKPGRKGY